MRIHKPLAGMLLMLALWLTPIAANSQTSIQGNASPAASESNSAPANSPEQTVARLVAEVRAGRELIAEQRAALAALEEQVRIEQANSASVAASYASAQREIEQLRSSINHLERAIRLHEQTIALLTTDRDRARAGERRANRRALWATVGAVASIAIKFL